MNPLSMSMLPPPSLGPDPASLTASARQRDAHALDEAASNFESMFVSMLVKQMRQTLEPDTMFANDPSDILGGLFDLTMGQHLAQAGALGIGAMVRQQWMQGHNP